MSLLTALRNAVAAQYAANGTLNGITGPLNWRRKPGQVSPGTTVGTFWIKEQPRYQRTTERVYLQPFDVTFRAYSKGQAFDSQTWAAAVESLYIDTPPTVTGASSTFNVIPQPAELDFGVTQLQGDDVVQAVVTLQMILSGQET